MVHLLIMVVSEDEWEKEAEILFKEIMNGNSLVVQLSELFAFTAKSLCSLPGPEFKSSSKTKKKEKREWKIGWKSPKSGEIYLHPGPWR